MSTAIRRIGLALAALVLAGCSPRGLLYSNTVEPYSWEFHRTPVGTKQCVVNDYRLKEPVTGYSISAEWTSSYLLREAKKAGIRDIYYIDKHTLSLLNGLYKRDSYIIYGN